MGDDELSKRINFTPTGHDVETLKRLKEVYPHLNGSGIIRELFEEWRRSREEGSKGERIKETQENSRESLTILRKLEKELL